VDVFGTQCISKITYFAVSQSVIVPCQNSGIGGSHGFFLPSFSHLNEVQRSKPSRALQPPKQGTSLPPPSSLTLDSANCHKISQTWRSNCIQTVAQHSDGHLSNTKLHRNWMKNENLCTGGQTSEEIVTDHQLK